MKHKKLLAILLSLAIMVTFMPMMAFAATTPDGAVWNSDFTSVNITSGGVTKTFTNIKKTWNNQTGLVTAEVDWDGYEIKGWNAETKYLDFNAAAITGNKNVSYNTFNTTYGYNKDKKTLASGYGIELTKPSYITGTDASKVDFEISKGVVNADVVFTVEGFDPDNKYEDQPVTVSARFVPADPTADMVAIEPTTLPTKSVTVTAVTGVASDVKFTFDKVKGNPVEDTIYDGKTHKIVNNEVKGFTVEYFVLNETTKKYDKVDAIEFKNAGYVQGKAVVTETDTNKKTSSFFNFTVEGSGLEPSFYFDDSSVKKTDYRNVYSVPANANPMDYVVAYEVARSDEEEAMKYFADRYDIKVTSDKADANIVVWTIKEKDDLDKTALNKKYATFLKNYPKASLDLAYDYMQVVLAKDPEPVVVNDQDDDINFSGVTKYVYSGKKAIKKGKLKKNQTIAVKAVADSGNEITFSATTADKKITVNSTTGKITVKKGLKKGTYKVEVTAKTVAGNGYKAAKATATYTIVVKKK
jgi:hypothetical protein